MNLELNQKSRKYNLTKQNIVSHLLKIHKSPMYADFFRLGFFYEPISEAELAHFLKRHGWTYVIHDIKRIASDDPCFFCFCFVSQKSILVDVKLNAKLRVWFALKTLTCQLHQQFVGEAKHFKTDEQNTSIAEDIATTAIIPPAELINLYKAGQLQGNKSFVAEFNVTQDIATHAMLMLQNYYIENPHRDEFFAGLLDK